MTHSRKQILEMLDASDLRPSRALGQNFVADGNTVRRIVRLAKIQAGQHVIEIGAGLGSLTLALADTGATVKAVEIDRRVIPILRDVVKDRHVEVIEGDALTLDWTSAVPKDGPTTVVANLPYNIGSLIVVRLLEEVPTITTMLVMVQREVAERLAATVGDSQYGALSVKIAYYAKARLVGSVSRKVFIPEPKVDSALVEFTRLATPAVDPAVATEAEVFALVRVGFSQRRKMLRRVLGELVTPEAFACAGISPTSRAEELDVIAWGRLAVCVKRTMSSR